MRAAKVARSLLLSVMLSSATLAGVLTPAQSVLARQQQLEIATAGDLANSVWSKAMSGKGFDAFAPIDGISPNTKDPELASLLESRAELRANVAKWEEVRAKKLDEAWKELEKDLAADAGIKSLSQALKHAVEVQLLSKDHNAILKDERIVKLIDAADGAARRAEAAGDWLGSSELFFRLHTLLDESGKYKPDVERLSDRLAMLRLYVPKRFYDLRVAQAKNNGEEKPIPPFNALGEDFNQKLKGIDDMMVLRAIVASSEKHVDHDTGTLPRMVVGGLGAVKTMVTTADLQAVFPGLAETDARERMLAFLDGNIQKFSTENAAMSRTELISLSQKLLQNNQTSVKLPSTALLHEFGNGCMSQLDEFSTIVWPDEKAKFDRLTQGEFFGVGVQIQFDEEAQTIKVVTPLDGTPAQRAGVRAGDLIKKINGESAIGLSTTQAVDLITGPKGSKVNLTMERNGEDHEFNLVRDKIPLNSVTGWKRTGARDDKWDWFVDPVDKIGYVRLIQFQEDTTSALRAAIRTMEKQGLNGLILDLRFNPGGLLTQAHSVANAFVGSGTIVSTTSGERLRAQSDNQLVSGIPIAVLINEGSASASEIVSGALKHYADQDQIRAVIVGTRTFGKGSVQNVLHLNEESTAALKITTQYYKVPTADGSGYVLHRRPGANSWGIDAHVKVEMLPDQIADSFKLRQDADVLTIDENGNAVPGAAAPDPQKLIDDGLDLQLQTALVLLQSQVVGKKSPQARISE